MRAHLRPCVVLFSLLSLLTGVVYPAFITVVAQTVFPYQAAGSLIQRDGRTVGSELIGQSFDAPQYFWGRPSATSPQPYNSGASSGSNLSPTNPALLDAIKNRVTALRAAHPEHSGPIPVDLVTASASGLDPHISPAAAEYQATRIARVRGLNIETVRKLVSQHTEARTFGVLGEPRVNVLQLNQALDAASKTPN